VITEETKVTGYVDVTAAVEGDIGGKLVQPAAQPRNPDEVAGRVEP